MLDWLTLLGFRECRECWNTYPYSHSDRGRLIAISGTNPNCYRTLHGTHLTLVVVEGVGYLVHDEVGVPEEAVNAVVEVNADIVLVLLQAEMAEVEVFQPVIVQLHCDRRLSKERGTRS